MRVLEWLSVLLHELRIWRPRLLHRHSRLISKLLNRSTLKLRLLLHKLLLKVLILLLQLVLCLGLRMLVVRMFQGGSSSIKRCMCNHVLRSLSDCFSSDHVCTRSCQTQRQSAQSSRQRNRTHDITFSGLVCRPSFLEASLDDFSLFSRIVYTWC